MTKTRLNTNIFYNEWSGHPPEMLEKLVYEIRSVTTTRDNEKQSNETLSSACEDQVQLSENQRCVIWLAGDSSLDNKYWLGNQFRQAVNGYEHVMQPPKSKPDICHWLNVLLVERGLGEKYVAVNTAVEASTLAGRLGKTDKNGVPQLRLPHDKLVRNSLGPDDTLIISVGGNDIAMAPSLSTIFNMLVLTRLNSAESIASGSSCASAHFVRLFGKRVQSYATALIQGSHRPSRIIACMIYFPDEMYSESWANTALGSLGYNTSPEKLQAAIKYVFENATSQIQIPGVDILPFPLFRVLDGKCTEDYVARVEPSAQGGRKMAEALLEAMTIET